MTRLAGWALVLVVLSVSPAAAVEDLEVRVAPESLQTGLGSTEVIEVLVSNSGTQRTGMLSVHIDITDPQSEFSVDPEDWTPELTQLLGSVDPGDSVSLTWELQPITAGSYFLYAVVFEEGSLEVATSRAVVIEVLSNRILNPEGVLPAVIGVPAVVAFLLGLVTRRRRRAG